MCIRDRFRIVRPQFDRMPQATFYTPKQKFCRMKNSSRQNAPSGPTTLFVQSGRALRKLTTQNWPLVQFFHLKNGCAPTGQEWGKQTFWIQLRISLILELDDVVHVLKNSSKTPAVTITICDLVQQNGVTGPKCVFAIHVVEVPNVNTSGTSRPICLKIEAGTYIWS